MRLALRAACLASALLAPLASYAADVVVIVPNSPTSYESTQGEQPTFLIFGVDPQSPTQTSGRYMEVFKADQFPAGGGLVKQIAIRRYSGSGMADSVDVELRLALTNKAPDYLSSTFSDNPLGGVETVVMARQTLTLAPPFEAGPGTTEAFNVVFPIDPVFTYHPAQGNLLLDLLIYQKDSTTPLGSILYLDQAYVYFDSVSSLQSTDVAAATGTVASYALITQFTLPEPHGSALDGAALLALSALARRHRARIIG